MIRLLCTDFDGTIFCDKGDGIPISQSFVAKIKVLKDKGVKWVISTGRNLTEIISTLNYYQLPVYPDFLSVLEREIYIFENSEYVPLQPWNQICDKVHKELYTRIAPLLSPLEKWIIENYPKSMLYKDGYSPLCFIAPDNKEADKLLEYIAKYFEGIPDLALVRNDVYARLAHINYNKGATLLELEHWLGITPAETCVAGDHYNDLPMLSVEKARYLISPLNAIDVVKESVLSQNGYVAQQVAGDGIAEGMNYFF